MKLTKKPEAEALKVYKAYWDAYLNGDMKTFASMLDDDITVFGTAVSEVFNNKKETLRFYKATADQLVGKAQFRNRKISVNEVGDNVLVNEQCDLYFLMDKKRTFYGHVRVSAIFTPKKTGWKLLHQHASFPDIRAEEGEQIAAEKIRAENLQLRDAVKRRTIELEEKNRELEIETSLEKVRAQALGMHKADELLNVCKVLFKELIALGFTGLRNAIIHRFNDDKAYFTDYDYSDTTGGAITNISYKENPIIKKFIKQIRKSDNAFVQINIKGNELKNWKRFRKKGGQPDDPLLNKASAIHYYMYSIENASIGISTFNVIDKEQLRLLKRFRNVFDFAYRRYMDMAQAEAQRREAQIEVAVERVRAKALAMHKSEEIIGVVSILWKELTALKIAGVIASTIYLRQEDGRVRVWDLTSANELKEGFTQEMDVVFNLRETDKRLWVSKVLQSNSNYSVIEESDFAKVFHWVEKFVGKKAAMDGRQFIKANNVKKLWIPTVSLEYGRLSCDFIQPPPAEMQPILLKMGAAFDLAYKRFLDLQNAEAQAREAQIEAALERVRSRTMAMQKTDELLDAAELVHKELAALGINSMNVSYAFVDEEEKYGSYYSINPVDGRILPIPFVFPHTETEVMRSILASWKKQESYNVIELKEKATIKHQTYIGKHIQQQLAKNNVPFSIKEFLKISPKKAVLSTFNFANGYLFNIGGERLSKTQEELMLRFTRVFEQTYTRFLDLQKAEAQTKEAQIEAALERVRSRTMGMQKSEELKEVIQVVYDQFVHLNIHVEHTGFIMDYRKRDDMHIWLADKHAVPFQVTIPYFDCAHWNSFKEAKEKGIDFFTNQLSFEEKNKFYRDLFKLIPGVPEETLEYYFSCPGLAISTVLLENVGLYIENFSGIPYTNEENNTLMRFGKVFQQTYTRFLDLQKAEAQAREAQIELGLERVRARAMAMQNSDELKELIGTVFTELTKLDLVLTRCVIMIYDGQENTSRWWMANSEDPNNPAGFFIRQHEHPPMIAYFKAWRERKVKYTYPLQGKIKQDWDDFLFSETELKNLPGFVIEGMKAPDLVYLNASFNNFGNLTLASLDPLSDEHFDILLRFAKVFDLTYTRFNDLKQAEAQARESQIQLALERVRARTMAMQKSDELLEVVATLYEQLSQLNFDSNACNIIIIDKETNNQQYWVSGFKQKLYPESYNVPYFEHPYIDVQLQAWRQGQKYTVIEYSGKTKKEFDKQFFSLTEFKNIPQEVQKIIKALESAMVSTAFFAYGALQSIGPDALNDENAEILRRFASVFDQTYTRFLDLQKAEALAREAQIEAALEKVRARTMGMQKSDELAEVVGLLFKQFEQLDFGLYQLLISIYDTRNNIIEWWSKGLGDVELPQRNIIPIIDHPFPNILLEKWKSGTEYYAHTLEGELKNSWEDYLFTQTDLKYFPQQVKDAMKSLDKVYLSDVFIKYGSMQAAGPIPLPDDKAGILKRFAKVLDQAYTRMTDLQKAEEQTREAKIETALERVRARAMAMHTSQELKDVALELRIQMGTMAQPELEVCAIHLYEESPDHFEAWAAIRPPGAKGKIVPLQARFPKRGVKIVDEMMKAYHDGKKDYVLINEGEKLLEWLDQLKEQVPEGFEMVLESFRGIDPQDSRTYWSLADFQGGALVMTTYIPPNDEARSLLRRFANVFGLAYRRFVDLKQAEAQAKESELELALERVRAKSMAMRHSEELSDLVKIVFKELTRIGFSVNACIIMTYDERTNDSTWWISNFDGVSNPFGLFVPNHSNEPYLAYLNEWKKQTPKWRYKLGGVEKKKWDQYLFNNSGLATLPDMVKTGMQSAEEAYLNVCFNKYASITFGSFEPMSDKDFDTLHRFAKVFEQSYTRFLDLQKAEAQAREAHIETALERVRARTMGMHQSKELHDVIETVTKQLLTLGLKFDNSVFCRINQDESWEMWMSTPQQSYPSVIYVPYLDHRIFHNLKEVKAKNLEFYADVFEQDEARVFFKHFFENTIAKDVPEERKQYVLSSSGMARSLFLTKDIWFVISRYSPDPFNDEENGILKRFAKVFEQAYIRFLDLVKAEAQAKEARIEIALERIRARALAMHKSDELMEVAKVMREQMALLGQAELEASAVHLYEEDPDHVLSWRAVTIGSDANREITYGHMAIPKNSCEFVQEWLTKFYSDLNEYTIELSGSKQQEWYEVLFKLAPEVINSMRQKHSMDEKRYYRFSKFSGGALLMIAKQEPSTEATYLQERAAVVFDLAYRRFSDLQKAEAQAREAQIEAALERVRAKAMAMHSSRDLAETLGVFYRELKSLSAIPIRCGVALMDKETRIAELTTMNTTGQGDSIEIVGKIKMAGHPVLDGVFENWLMQKEFHAVLRGNQIKEYYQVLKPQISYLDYSHDEVQFGYYFMFKEGDVYAWTEKELTEDELTIYRRFTTVISLTYKRYKDLQQAEAQAKEAQIEAALEKVRSRSLAMHKSDELQEVITTVFDRLSDLNIEAATASILIPNDDNTVTETWIQNAQRTYSAAIYVPYFEQSAVSRDFQNVLIHKKDLLSKCYSQKEKNEWFTYLFDKTEMGKIPDERKEYVLAGESYCVSIVRTKHGGVHLGRYINKPFTDEENSILRRFANVFEQAYIRFLDLQRAEANAREAQIQLALERVRAITMAMHSSEDVTAATEIMFDELKKLGIDSLRCGIANIHHNRTFDVFGVTNLTKGNKMSGFGLFGMDEHPIWQRWFESWTNKDEVFIAFIAGKEKEEYFNNINNHNNYLPQQIVNFPDSFFEAYYFEQGAVWTYSLVEHSEPEKQIMKRFAAGFSLTFRRYQDLKKAEAQAREAQIEAGLERVRARTMAMHSSEDVSMATATMFTELEKLGIENLRGGITIIKPDQTQEVWSITNLPDGRTIRAIGVFDMSLHPLWRALFKAKENKEDYHYYWLAGKDKEDYMAILNETPNYLAQPIKEIPDVHVQSYFFGEGGVWTNSLQPHSEEDKQIMKRFASVFSLTFRRYQDLKKAEAQAREATIEAALERVRAKAMSMHNSQDLTDTIGVFYKELQSFSITPRRCGVGLLDKEEKVGELFTWNTTEKGESLELVGKLKLEGHPVLEGVYEHWLTQKEYHPVLRGNEIKEYYKIIRPQIAFPDYEREAVHYGYFFFFKEGGVYAWTEKEMTEDELQIYRRFTSVLSLTYKRYKDLKQAEASAKEAIRQASLDRVRAEIASMRTVEDLQRITPVIWNELTTLNIPFIRCGIFIMDDTQQLIHTFLSTPNGKAIAAFHLPYNTPGNIGLVIHNWRNKGQYIDHWDESEFQQFAQILVQQGALDSAENYLKTIPHGGFYLHFLPFLQGMLYVGNTDQLKEEEIELIQHVADAFSTAYARYEDFNKLEAAKQQVEKTLTDLKQAQTQLVQSEKMASLGELTAGIAHEIQNPLNFVNNFSDVSNELLEEMKNELEKGNAGDAMAIVEDIKQNLEKILHHGKRADAIVKGMLQHSRKSSGQKEPTDINMLADEYLRLAFHGLRAKDKSFNAKFETGFDNNIGKINIIPQDIGRVILNLINNAFYAVTEKKKQESNGYEPTVAVYTKKLDDRIEIKVKDNGNGIPQKVLDKIFQPFFTTKPTGEGTGLGLSLSYDIITKGHGGELKVETKEGEGSEFIIQLPGI